jgi:hypothetical protein
MKQRNPLQHNSKAHLFCPSGKISYNVRSETLTVGWNKCHKALLFKYCHCFMIKLYLIIIEASFCVHR